VKGGGLASVVPAQATEPVTTLSTPLQLPPPPPVYTFSSTTTSLQSVNDNTLSPSFRRQLLMIADGNMVDRSELIMIAEGNVAPNPAGAEAVVMTYLHCTFLEHNLVLLDGNLFTEVDFGQYATDTSGCRHSNACFYLACASGVDGQALALKQDLAPLATTYSKAWATFKAPINFSGVATLADVEIFFVFAQLVGPICVANRSAGKAVIYRHPERPGAICYLHLRGNHFTRLVCA
jgi:hypothetical protein